jgi:formylglycine-generating enzyme required for sulfatase activity
MTTMHYMKHLSGLIATAACGVVLCGPAVEAAQVQVTNVATTEDGHVQFDISWTDSWRASWQEAGTDWTNWDAAWIFVKYHQEGEDGWSHATLSAKDTDHMAPDGATLNVGLTGKKGMGVFLYRSADGKGSWANKRVKLKWLHKDDGVKKPAKVELSVHALEMVYVPQGRFYAGAPGGLAGVFVDGSWKKGDAFIPFEMTSEAELQITNQPGCLSGTGSLGSPCGAAHSMGLFGSLSAEFPKGYGAFYCMKYETSQGEYTAFLNELPEAQASLRYQRAKFNPKHAKRPGVATYTITNAPTGYVATSPASSCTWIHWDDGAAYADWTGLRPMSELEYEKACRGPLKPVTNEYAWGTGTTDDTELPGFAEVPPAPYPVGLCGTEERIRTGSTYWGIAAMSGHLREITVSASHEDGRVFTAICGDGELTTNGLANVADWPGPLSTWPQSQTAGAGFRGGPWYGDANKDGALRISNRFLAACQRARRHSTYGWRSVRQAPLTTALGADTRNH